jgi:hypothetical protein
MRVPRHRSQAGRSGTAATRASDVWPTDHLHAGPTRRTAPHDARRRKTGGRRLGDDRDRGTTDGANRASRGGAEAGDRTRMRFPSTVFEEFEDRLDVHLKCVSRARIDPQKVADLGIRGHLAGGTMGGPWIVSGRSDGGTLPAGMRQQRRALGTYAFGEPAPPGPAHGRAGRHGSRPMPWSYRTQVAGHESGHGWPLHSHGVGLASGRRLRVSARHTREAIRAASTRPGRDPSGHAAAASRQAGGARARPGRPAASRRPRPGPPRPARTRGACRSH